MTDEGSILAARRAGTKLARAEAETKTPMAAAQARASPAFAPWTEPASSHSPASIWDTSRVVVHRFGTPGWSVVVPGAAQVAASAGAMLSRFEGGEVADVSRPLVSVKRRGQVEPLAVPPRPYGHPRVSPDG
jgi:hypothetical protein